MITTDLTTLKINKLTKAQYEAALAAGNINENELYMTPESEAGSGGDYATKSDLNAHVNDTTLHTTADEKTKLAGIEANANNYTHPSSHPATMITEDATHRFVTDTEKVTWNNKASKSTIITTTLLASNWDSTAKIYSFEADYPSKSYDIEVEINGDSCTDEQLEAWVATKPVSSLKNKINAKGDVPSVDIPIILTVIPNENPISLISFIISIADTEDHNYQAENGMTWDEWVASEYNTEGFSQTEYSSTYYEGSAITGSDVIVDGYRYISYA